VRRLRAWWLRFGDIIAARIGLWALNRLFGGGCAPPYDGDCIGCAAGRVAEVLEDIVK